MQFVGLCTNVFVPANNQQLQHHRRLAFSQTDRQTDIYVTRKYGANFACASSCSNLLNQILSVPCNIILPLIRNLIKTHPLALLCQQLYMSLYRLCVLHARPNYFLTKAVAYIKAVMNSWCCIPHFHKKGSLPINITSRRLHVNIAAVEKQ